MTTESPRQRFFIQCSQSVQNQSVEYRVVVPQAFMMELPRLRDFEGWFNVNNIELIDTKWDPPGHSDWISLNPEALSVQLMRLAYIAAMHEEGPFGESDAVSSPL
jgi:hypothetical protein